MPLQTRGPTSDHYRWEFGRRDFSHIALRYTASQSVADAFDLILTTASPSVISVSQTQRPHPLTDRLAGAWIGRWVAGGSVELSVSHSGISQNEGTQKDAVFTTG